MIQNDTNHTRRDKCIGYNACLEAAYYRWRINRQDGKCKLVGSTEKRGFHSVLVDEHELEENLKEVKNCPIHIIQVLTNAK